MNTDSQWSKHEACFAHATQVWLTVNHTISVTLSVLHGQVRSAPVNQNYVFHEAMNCCKKSKDSLNACFENVKIINMDQIHLESMPYFATKTHAMLLKNLDDRIQNTCLN